MEYMEWRDLGHYIHDRWDESDAAIVTHQLLCGLQYLHQNGITHRDLKPAVSIIPFKARSGFSKVIRMLMCLLLYIEYISISTRKWGIED